jgi:hypothetical protein
MFYQRRNIRPLTASIPAVTVMPSAIAGIFILVQVTAGTNFMHCPDNQQKTCQHSLF